MWHPAENKGFGEGVLAGIGHRAQNTERRTQNTERRTQDAGDRVQEADAGHRGRTQGAGRRAQDAGDRTQETEAGHRTQDAGDRTQETSASKKVDRLLPCAYLILRELADVDRSDNIHRAQSTGHRAQEKPGCGGRPAWISLSAT